MLDIDAALQRRSARAGRLRFGTTESWVIWQLSGGRLHITDPSTASRTLLFDLNRLDWDDELLALFDVPRAILPEIRPSAGYAGDYRPGRWTSAAAARPAGRPAGGAVRPGMLCARRDENCTFAPAASC